MDDDEDYDYYPVNDCDHKNTVYDVNDEDYCNHGDFDEATPVHDKAEYSNSKNFPSCCQTHAYLFHDKCDVNQIL